jgi:DNA-binding LacI/PurR family transcriptional regulator
MADTKTRSTIFDVAEAAGVSITTVSHVFSGKRRVNELTRKRVIDAAEQLSYRPRAIARALAAGRTNTLALSVSIAGPDLLLNSFFAKLLPALSLAALDRGYSFLYVPPDAGAELTESLLDAGRVDAAVLIVPSAQDPFVRAVLEAGTPYVSIGPLEGSSDPHWVGTEPREVSTLVLDHLRERGYERFGLLSPAFKVTTITQYEATFRSIVGPDAPVVESAHASEWDAYEAAVSLLGGDDRPDGVVCLGDSLAVGALRACDDLGLRVPEDVGIVSVVESALTTHVSPELTAVDVNEALLAERALEVLDLLLASQPVPDGFARVPVELVPRASTARES